MAFRLKLNEPMQKGFRRIGLSQIERARQELIGIAGEPQRTIHEARKAMKRVRALLRLARPGLGEDIFKTENMRFREIAQMLAPARDRHVLLDTILTLETAEDGSKDAIAALKAAIKAEPASDPPASPEEPADALDKLKVAAERFRKLKLAPDDLSTMVRGLEISYRKARHAFARAYELGGDEDFHEWRKGVQQHWRQMALLSRAWPEMMEARVRAARELSQILGSDHDLAMVAAFAAACPPDRLEPKYAAEIVTLARSKQAELRRVARPKGLILFAERARTHSRHVAKLWAAAEALNQQAKRDLSGSDRDRDTG